ncbi:ribosomal L1 domain-containing protein 1 [Tribolium castaneum]|uniref:Ribosomal L1 domain-containing protein CG13096-like Protein n=1 Tax=Tribolium castaneum TaxID=7070 RepID=D6WVH9_TRICA|nr:PREDICTED: ribosomal L1 domain-containing protein 1 [Tribolium castaneum]EFA08295.1 Ribosomal L1 domain-containing protein CG13096-like Protein [Tribolium castaneum]|eukprot:XP_001812465.1 PREDICTED: ribosomal L1 domain-containing protein 1 [Tribolium castaneum]
MLKSALLAKLQKSNSPKSAPKTKTKKLKNGAPIEEAPKVKRRDSTVKVETPKLKSRRKSIVPPSDFDEEICELGAKFRVDPANVRKGLQGLIKFTSENPKLKNKLFDDEQFPIFLQINSVKVAKGHPKIVRIPLKHSIHTPDSEVCLIVPDVKGIPNKNHEEHLEHYEKLLRQKGVNNIKKVMTFHEFRTEYETYELRSRLVELYDVFLVDGKISGKTVRKCGKIFYKKRKVPTSVKLQVTKLKEHIEQTLKKTPLYLHAKGDSFMVQIGHSKMQVDELVENCFYIFKGLEKDFYGGFGNVRSVNLYAHRGLTIPIYTTLKNQNKVEIPKVAKKTVVETVSGELSTRLNSGVTVEPTGEVTVYKLNETKKRKRKNTDEED